MSIHTSPTPGPDPTLVPGIYNMCDSWCMYCHATAWCLSYRYTSHEQAEGDVGRSLTARLLKGVMLLKQLWEGEGGDPEDPGALALNGPALRAERDRAGDPLVKRAEHYRALVVAYLESQRDGPTALIGRAGGPRPLEIVAWYHTLLPAKIYRALVSAMREGPGDTALHDDALASAKVVLIGIDRSIDALAALDAEAPDQRLPLLQGHLRRLRGEVERRFPAARTFVRPGLDPVQR